MIIFWEWVFTGSSSPILLPLVAAKLLVFTAECKLLVFKVVVLLWSRGLGCKESDTTERLSTQHTQYYMHRYAKDFLLHFIKA